MAIEVFIVYISRQDTKCDTVKEFETQWRCYANVLEKETLIFNYGIKKKN